jgi:hypothetical protein
MMFYIDLQQVNLPFVTWDPVKEEHNECQITFVLSMAAAYMACAAWADGDDQEFVGKKWSDQAVHQSRLDCTAFLSIAGYAVNGLTPEQLGHDLWLTRNGHGTGFWDRDEIPEHRRQRLTQVAKVFGSCDIYIGDYDDKIYLT